MFSTDSIPGGPAVIIFVLAFLLAFVVLVLAVVAYLYKRQQNDIRRQDLMYREIAGRRRIRAADKKAVLERDNYTCQICGISRDFLDGFCEGLGDYLLLEVDHVQSVSQGGSGDNIDNLQCLCWRCNRKKGGYKTNEEVAEMIDYGVDYFEYFDPEDE